ncbi:MAG: MBL fold metallo-hydrolase [Propionibacteriaceae bacterium]|nr:MBL fold metallo-hydrolase [Propionibacteriaceae bacterium]
MKLTHLGHAAVLLEVADLRILVDPGNMSDAWHGLKDLDAIFVTHLHPDHIDMKWLPALLEANPAAKLYVEPQVDQAYDLPGAIVFDAETSVEFSGVHVDAVGGLHAVIHRDIPRIGNVGFVVSAEGEPRFFHPGDSLKSIPQGVDVLAIPAYAPWAAMKKTIDFTRAVYADFGFLIHEGLLNERGWDLVFERLAAMSPAKLIDMRDGNTVEFK